jgi:hypothetical protein
VVTPAGPVTSSRPHRSTVLALLLGLVWVPLSLAFGPLLLELSGLHNLLAGALLISPAFIGAGAWHVLDASVLTGPPAARRHPASKRPPAAPQISPGANRDPSPAILLVVVLALATAGYAAGSRYYSDRFSQPRTVLVTGEGCHKTNHGCTEYVDLATPDRTVTLGELEDPPAAYLVGRQIVVRWDRRGHQALTMIGAPGLNETFPADGTSTAKWWFLGLLPIYLAVIGFAAVNGRKRRAARRG